jgi:hypothetical protein
VDNEQPSPKRRRRKRAWFNSGGTRPSCYPGLNHALERTLVPMHREFVTEASTSLGKGIGASVSRLAWLETLPQYSMKPVTRREPTLRRAR